MRRVRAEAFRRFCMSYDAWIVGYGLSRVLIVLELLASPTAYVVWLGVGCIDIWLLYAYFTSRRLGAVEISSGSYNGERMVQQRRKKTRI